MAVPFADDPSATSPGDKGSVSGKKSQYYTSRTSQLINSPRTGYSPVFAG
jgi:hypothetical protein